MVAISETTTTSTPIDRRVFARHLHVWLGLLLAASILASIAIGAAHISLWSALSGLLKGETLPAATKIVLWDIRLPRTIMGFLIGATLAVSGALLQGLFRNPLADPSIVGVSTGASLGAITAIVLGGALPAAIASQIGAYLVPAAAFLGSWIAVIVLYHLATRGSRTSVATMLLAGIALTALAGALSGLMIFWADDQQLRDLTFWQLGSLGGATWSKVGITIPIIALALVAALRLAPSLNCFALGETTALHLGIPVQRVKRMTILTVAAGTGAAVAASGGIGFIGIIVPHLLRLATGPDHKPLLINAALLGGALLIWADVLARIILAPAELPIGIVTAIMGAPVFLFILMRNRQGLGL
ncbi:iron ABC transporter permease [Roseovarius sp. EL26]|uniref:FecCD family ABC transporter permease n=1 Tax=Roseovarius sp. EL26 TaxID=2126672 RepID=UPI000EA11F20|nr:iron ABC transporter permease [Roseovarius sp. EL26]